MTNITLNWLSGFADGWLEREQSGRIPHAVALVGRPGLGKRAAADWIVRRQLQVPASPERPAWPLVRAEHADLHWVAPPDDRATIGIDQVRALIGELALTSYEGRGKAAVIEPANAMTDNAANSLLKTLEEPSGNALLVLVVDRLGRLPATIFSRCQQIRFSVPPTTVSLDWLARVDAGNSWETALKLAGGAPLAAVEGKDWSVQAATLSRDFHAVAAQTASPLEVAARWAKLDTNAVLDWLALAVQHYARRIMLGSGAGESSNRETVLRRVDRRNLFCYLDIINGLRAQAPGSFAPDLAFESLLIDWADGLRSLGNRFEPGELLPAR